MRPVRANLQELSEQTQEAAKPQAVPRGPDYSSVGRNLALELVRVTEAAAIASGRWCGKGDKEAADQAAVDAMRVVLTSVDMDGIVIIGEGEKDEAPMLYCGEHVGNGGGPEMEVAVDPLDGTTLTAQGRNGAVSVLALAEKGALFDPGPCMYMEKIAVGPQLKHAVHIERSVGENLRAAALCLQKDVQDVCVVILDRERHKDLIRQCRQAGARVKLIQDGDVAAAIATAQPSSGIDIMYGIGGTPEGVIAACALKTMGGELQGRLWPRNLDEKKRALEAKYDLDKVLTTDDLVKGDEIFFAATGVTDGDLLRGFEPRVLLLNERGVCERWIGKPYASERVNVLYECERARKLFDGYFKKVPIKYRPNSDD
ncbi:hypothetical protein CYMTET_55304 [Cymbomonas tetramitiformis]|uniref:Fructose-1,6-bisphosphatase n=1 Tax=Cymbomonas tetramitiformis TaxID=36881 RepID=A0AAE0BD81_9CHLO|nr:hypothetical protein CYMTET_55304 [Cymbomonas tetramitiformis]